MAVLRRRRRRSARRWRGSEKTPAKGRSALISCPGPHLRRWLPGSAAALSSDLISLCAVGEVSLCICAYSMCIYTYAYMYVYVYIYICIYTHSHDSKISRCVNGPRQFPMISLRSMQKQFG